MFCFLPFITFILLFLIFQRKTSDWRNSFLAATIVWGVVLEAITEALGVFTLITFGWILGLWIFACTSAFFIYFVFARKTESLPLRRVDETRLSSFLISLLVGIAFIVAAVGLTALLAPPNNGDAMAYHLARVVHWIQNHSVYHYPTSVLRQLYLNPWAEFAVMNFQILSGGDYLANSVQWFAMVGSLIGVSLIAKQFGANVRCQIFAVVVCATIPMGILQASSAQNDYVVAFWLVCFVYYLLLLKKQPNLICSLAVGAALGLALLTKTTAYLYAFPFLIWFGLSNLNELRLKLLQPFLIIAVIVFFINFGHYARNFDLFGSPIGISEENGYETVNDIFTPSSLFSNVTRNIGLHLGTPVESINAATETGIVFLNALFGIDINDSRTTWLGAQFHVPMLSSDEDDAGNPIHFILILLSMVFFLIYKRKNKFSALFGYSLALIGAFLLFCLFLRWQPWHSRLHLSLFVLWSPFIAVVLSKTISRRIIDLLLIILIMSGLPWVFYNHNHPFVRRNNILNASKIDLYFSASMDLREPFIEATDLLKSQQCLNVGLLFGSASREYPLWQLLQEGRDKPVRIEHIDVSNISGVKQNINLFDQFNPCAIISDKPQQSENISTENGVYVRKVLSGTVSVFVKQ